MASTFNIKVSPSSCLTGLCPLYRNYVCIYLGDVTVGLCYEKIFVSDHSYITPDMDPENKIFLESLMAKNI
jgi:hypothetical protein